MKYFKQLFDLPVYTNLAEEYAKIRDEHDIPYESQVCLNSTVDDPDNPFKGAGSIYFNWEDAEWREDENGHEYLHVEPYENPLSDSDFKVLCSQFKGTVFEELYNFLDEHYNIGRVVLFKSKRGTCLGWHRDRCKRLHFPIKTQEGCFMIVQDEMMHLPQETWWLADTTVDHTAVNASKSDRLHLVVNILDDKK